MNLNSSVSNAEAAAGSCGLGVHRWYSRGGGDILSAI